MNNGHDPALAGAVDLSGPVQEQIRNFARQMAQHGGVACVLVGVAQDGHITVTAQAQGGMVQVLGMLSAAGYIVTAQQGNR